MPFNRPIPDSKPRTKPVSALASLMEAEKMMQIAFLLPAAAFVGWLAGAWADSFLHQSWIGLAGIIFGGVSGLVCVVRMAIAAGLKTAGDTRNEISEEKKSGTGKGSSETNP
jgi:F0F1-type ATP synthase assembly protein I